MSEERLQEIKDSVNFQREILLAHNMGTLCVDEEQELIEEIERLNNIINELERTIYYKAKYFRDIKERSKVEICMDILNKLQELERSEQK